MRISVFAWDSDPTRDRRLYPISQKEADRMLFENRARRLTLPDGRCVLQKFPPQEVLLEKSARNYVSSIGRVLNKLMDPPSLNYPIPAVGDYRLSWRYSFMHKERETQPAA